MTTSRTIVSSTTYVISVGQIDTGDTILDGAALVVDSGGTASGTVVLGIETISGGGADEAALTGSNGLQIVASGSVASGTVVHVWTARVEQEGWRRFADRVRFIHVSGLLHAAPGRWP